MPTVLFADADRETRAVHAWLLDSCGFKAGTLGRGLACLATLRAFAPDLLILDLELPRDGGDGVLAAPREDARLLPARVVLTSAGAPARVVVGPASPPVVQALAKPLQPSDLFERGARAAFLEHEQRPGGTEPCLAPADQARVGLPGASSLSGAGPATSRRTTSHESAGLTTAGRRGRLQGPMTSWRTRGGIGMRAVPRPL